MISLLFVCLGNICRSPTAEATMASLLAQRGLDDAVELDSAGTGSWHVGEPPDARASAAAKERGIELAGHARQVQRSDFERFDLILAMDASNARELRALARDGEQEGRVRLLREFDECARESGQLDVPDPYYGGPDGFERVLDVVQRACEGLLDSLGLDRAGGEGPARPTGAHGAGATGAHGATASGAHAAGAAGAHAAGPRRPSAVRRLATDEPPARRE
ncbi:MAG: low molecular weight protein-tyrosine-phosphatase [Solirubrobacteraceae bacterium]